MKPPDHSKINHQIYAEASEWLVEFRSGDVDASARKTFYLWLRTSPEHMRAYLELAAIWNEGSGLDAAREFDDSTLLESVRADANVVTLETGGLAENNRRTSEAAWPDVADPDVAGPEAGRSRPPPQRVLAVAASLLLAAGAAGAWLYTQRNVYSTRTGEQHAVTLRDGSRIELNSHSRVRIEFSPTQRRIDLLEGEVLFDVAKDRARPFVVRSGPTQVTAVGTQFDVFRKTAQTTVTVVEGRVAVAQTTDEVLLSAGEQAVATAQAVTKRADADIPAATAWTQGHMLFSGSTLQQVAEEFSRYSARRLIIRDPQLANLKVTGIFSSTDSAPLIRFLKARPGVRVTETETEIVVSREP